MDGDNRYVPHRVGVLAATVLLSLVVVSCAGAGGRKGGVSPASASGRSDKGGTSLLSNYHPAKGTPGGSLSFSDWEAPGDLNPISDSSGAAIQATNELYSQLWTFDPSNKIVPFDAAVIPTQENGLVKITSPTTMTVTIKLRPGLEWSNGQPLTVADYIRGWKAICDPAAGSWATEGYDHISRITEVSPTEMILHFGPDPAGKRCGLSAPLKSGLYAAYLTLGVPPWVPVPSSLDKIPHSQWATSSYFTKDPDPASGPYVVKSFSAGSGGSIVFAPNPDFSKGRTGARFFNHEPYLNQLTYLFQSDEAGEVTALRSAATDMGTDLTGDIVPSLRSDPNLHVIANTTLLDEMLLYNLGNDETGCAPKHYIPSCGTPTIFKNDINLREAFNLVINKAAINKSLVGGLGVVMNSPFMSNFAPWYDRALPKWHRNLAKAKQLMKSAGWKVGRDGIATRDGKRCSYTISTTTGNPQRTAEEEQILHDTRQLGCVGTIKNYPDSQFTAGFASGGPRATGQFDVLLFADFFLPDPDQWSSLALISQIPSASSPAGFNLGRWHDKKLDSLFKQGAATMSLAKRIKIYDEIQREWVRYAGADELYERPAVFAADSRFGNFYPQNGAPLVSWNSADWYAKG